MKTVKQVISMLKKVDQNAIIAFSSHDNMVGEIQGHVNNVHEENMDECESEFGLKGNYVILTE